MKRNALIFLVVVPFVSSGAIAVIGLLLLPFFWSETEFVDLIIIASCIVIFFIFLFFFYLLKNYYNIKYFFSKRKYRELITPSLKRFQGADEEFIKGYVTSCKDAFRRLGNIKVPEYPYFSANIYKKSEGIRETERAFKLLSECEKNGGGFLGFFDKISKAEFESTYQVYEYLQVGLVSDEFRYFIRKVYNDTEFDLNDNGMSKEYTEKIEKATKRTVEVYNAVLSGFDDEITDIIAKLGTLKDKREREENSTIKQE